MKQILILFLGISLLQAQIKEVKIGQQVWTTENLNVDKFRNGEIIPEAKTAAEWHKAGENKQAAWCYYNNDSSNGTKYGKLYNWYAVNDPRGLAPKGWHIPSDQEWTDLTDYLGGDEQAGAKMKSKEGWSEYEGEIECKACKQWSPQQQASQQCDVCGDTRKLRAKLSGNGTNESGFKGLPGGSRSSNGTFFLIGDFGYWWSSTEYDTYFAWNRYLSYCNGNVSSYYYYKELGFSVRCLRDSR